MEFLDAGRDIFFLPPIKGLAKCLNNDFGNEKTFLAKIAWVGGGISKF